ncbi:MAG: hypothetical protein DLM62_00835, partial [Pseudonocardiales bacterium]
HPDLRLPAYGGSLFDPAGHPWLVDAAVTDRVVREMLDALLVLRHKGKAAERLSYARLGVEQIGHVYEGLLEFSCRKVREPFVGLAGKAEPEVALAELESIAAHGELPQWLRTCCDATEKQVDKWLAACPSPHQRAVLHAACDNDAALAQRMLPFWGLLRTDLRGLPTVFPAGSVLFTQVGDRRSTGTHYTPRELAEEVVEHTLAPLCFAPGPAQGAQRGVWRAKTAGELLALKVVDPAMGSGAFLVSACRYLADRLVDAWNRDGVPDEVAELVGTEGDRDELLLVARRLVAARCLYGVDRDDMAVELAKLSLWLVTLAKNRPFGFLDHALRCGDSLVGLVSERQVAAFHLDVDRGWSVGTDLFRTLNERIGAVLTDVAELREEIESTVVRDARHAAEKADLLHDAEWRTRKLRLAADAVVGAALSTAVRHAPWHEKDDDEEDLDDRLTAIADDVDLFMQDGDDPSLEERLRETVDTWLRGGRVEPIRPLHWPLEFPEVMRRGGFDAVVGNPPFIGGQRLTGAIGKDVREYLVEHLSKGKRGSADLCSYFLLRNLDISWRGRVGIIATNTIAQGDTREVGLDQAVGNGVSVYRAVKSQPWPGTASLEVSLVWVGHAYDGEPRMLDGRQVRAITPSLDPESRVSGNPHRLAANADQSFQGSNILGLGFTVTPAAAQALISKDPRNRDVLFPYLIGEDLNSRPDCSASRWVINFHDWPIEQAQQYEDCFKLVEQKVKPERVKNTYSKTARERWWGYERSRPELYEAIDGLDLVIVFAQTSRTQIPVLVSAKQVLSHMLVVIAANSASRLGFHSSEIQYLWTAKYSASMKSDLRFIPTDCYENLPQPELTERLDRAGKELHSFRRSVMLGRPLGLGLTKLYNLVHDPAVTDEEIQRLREIHTEIDQATAEAYSWHDLDLGHGFHSTRQGRRFTIASDVQVEVLDRLLQLNHERYAEEVRQGLHTKKKPKRTSNNAQRPRIDGPAEPEGSLF